MVALVLAALPTDVLFLIIRHLAVSDILTLRQVRPHRPLSHTPD